MCLAFDLLNQELVKRIFFLILSQELEEMIDKHRIENEEWINARRQELEEERKQLELEKVMLITEAF